MDWEAFVFYLRMEGRCGTERWRGRFWRYDGSYIIVVGVSVCVFLLVTVGFYMRRINVIFLFLFLIIREKINLEKIRIEYEIVYFLG